MLRDDVRMAVAEKLLYWACYIVPKNTEGVALLEAVVAYMNATRIRLHRRMGA